MEGESQLMSLTLNENVLSISFSDRSNGIVMRGSALAGDSLPHPQHVSE
jgi:hypothetical protein